MWPNYRLAEQLERQESTILSELIGVQGKPVEIGGYYRPDPVKTAAAMRPSPTLNHIVDSVR